MSMPTGTRARATPGESMRCPPIHRASKRWKNGAPMKAAARPACVVTMVNETMPIGSRASRKTRSFQVEAEAKCALSLFQTPSAASHALGAGATGARSSSRARTRSRPAKRYQAPATSSSIGMPTQTMTRLRPTLKPTTRKMK